MMANPQEKSVLVIYTGGTIGMTNAANGGLAPAPPNDFKRCLRHRWGFLNIQENAEDLEGNGPHLLMIWPLQDEDILLQIHILIYDQLLDSSEMNYNNWMTIAQNIQEHYQNYDGFVVLHGTDTMAYTASALSFLFTNLAKPVVLTGSQVPIFKLGSDAVNNFEKAVLVAGTLEIPEVTLCFDNKLFRGNRTRKKNTTGFDAFVSPNFPPLAVFSGNRKLKDTVNGRLLLTPGALPGDVLTLSTDNNAAIANVRVVYIYPGITADEFDFENGQMPGALILRSYGAGNVPQIVRQTLDTPEWRERTLVVNVSQAEEGGVNAAYAIGTELENIGVVPPGDMTFEAAFTKLFIACMKEPTNKTRRKAFFGDIQKGERTVRRGLIWELLRLFFLGLNGW